MGPLVLGSDMLVQVPDVITPVSAVVAIVSLLDAGLAAGGPVLLCGGLQVEGEEGRQGSSLTGGRPGGSHTAVRLGSYTAPGLVEVYGAAGELDHGIVLELSAQLCLLFWRPA